LVSRVELAFRPASCASIIYLLGEAAFRPTSRRLENHRGHIRSASRLPLALLNPPPAA
jgi:hypothetical protein